MATPATPRLEALLQAGCRPHDLLDHSVREIFLFGIAAHLANGSTATDGLSGRGSEEPATGVTVDEVSFRT